MQGYLDQATSNYGPGHYTWSMIFLDLDDFKSVNTKHGEQAGDEVLYCAAKRIEMAVGDRGIVFRRGGEEFAVVLRLNQAAAMIVAEDIRRHLAGKKIVLYVGGGRVSVKVTASLGVASCISDVQSPDEMESAASARAREAKAAGKNCVVPQPSKELLIQSTQY